MYLTFLASWNLTWAKWKRSEQVYRKRKSLKLFHQSMVWKSDLWKSKSYSINERNVWMQNAFSHNFIFIYEFLAFIFKFENFLKSLSTENWDRLDCWDVSFFLLMLGRSCFFPFLNKIRSDVMEPKVVEKPLWKQRVKPSLELVGPESVRYSLVAQMSHESFCALICCNR